jgi:hypothetical protein
MQSSSKMPIDAMEVCHLHYRAHSFKVHKNGYCDVASTILLLVLLTTHKSYGCITILFVSRVAWLYSILEF